MKNSGEPVSLPHARVVEDIGTQLCEQQGLLQRYPDRPAASGLHQSAIL